MQRLITWLVNAVVVVILLAIGGIIALVLFAYGVQLWAEYYPVEIKNTEATYETR